MIAFAVVFGLLAVFVAQTWLDRQAEQRMKSLNAQKKPVANRDLWEPFVHLVNERGDVAFQWVKGHSGDRMNDFVDGLAVADAEHVAASSLRRMPGSASGEGGALTEVGVGGGRRVSFFFFFPPGGRRGGALRV